MGWQLQRTELKEIPAITKINLQITLEMKKNSFHSQLHVKYVLNNRIILTEKWLFMRFPSVDTGPCFSPWKNVPKFQNKISPASFNKSSKSHLNIYKYCKKVFSSQMEEYTIISEKQKSKWVITRHTGLNFFPTKKIVYLFKKRLLYWQVITVTVFLTVQTYESSEKVNPFN